MPPAWATARIACSRRSTPCSRRRARDAGPAESGAGVPPRVGERARRAGRAGRCSRTWCAPSAAEPAAGPATGAAPAAVGRGRVDLAAPRGTDQSGADVLPPGDGGRPPAGHRGGVGVPVAGGGARGAGQLDPAPGRHPAPPADDPPRPPRRPRRPVWPSTSCALRWRWPRPTRPGRSSPSTVATIRSRSPARSRNRWGWRWTCSSAWRPTASCTASPVRTPAAVGPARTVPSSASRSPPRTVAPDREATLEHPDYGPVVVRAWDAAPRPARARRAAHRRQVQVGRLPAARAHPPPCGWPGSGGPLPDDLHLVWRWYLRRFTVEHGLRFAKQTLGWTTVRPRDPAAADRWTWLVALAFWHLWLARPTRRRPAPALGSAPATRAASRRGASAARFVGLFVQVGTPARPPTPRGKSPGRRRGHAPGPHPRCAVVRRTPKRPTRRRKRRRTPA